MLDGRCASVGDGDPLCSYSGLPTMCRSIKVTATGTSAPLSGIYTSDPATDFASRTQRGICVIQRVYFDTNKTTAMRVALYGTSSGAIISERPFFEEEGGLSDRTADSSLRGRAATSKL